MRSTTFFGRSCVVARGLALGTALALVACVDDAVTDGASAAPTMSGVSRDPTPSHEALAAVVPGFGGFFLDAHGAPTVYLVDPGRRPEAEQALTAFLVDRGFTAGELRVRPARHEWRQLQAWHEAVWRNVLAVEGAVFTDIDEGSNRLRFGARDDLAVAAIGALVAQRGIPSDAAVVEESAPIQQLHTLRDRVRPVHGGYQLNFLDAAGVRTLSFLCTLGFNAIKNGKPSFITNSHCTNHQGGTTPVTEYYQPLMDPDGDRLVNPENFVGTEVDDPEYDPFSCAEEFVPGTVCRYSDAARAEYADGVPFALGRLARTTQSYQDTPRDEQGNRVPVLTVDPASPTFSIHKEDASVVGETVHKVGRTTGWTFGPIIQTCLNTLVLGTVPPIIQRCQDRVRADVAGGDSGSPVFRRAGQGGGNDKVRLVGILWGGSVSGEVTFVYSPMANIHQELGEFDTH